MRWSLAVLVLSGVAACGCRRDPRASGEHATSAAATGGAPASASAARDAIDGKDAPSGPACVSDPSFPTTLDVPEGSAAAQVELRPGVRELLVASDSENHGAALAYALPNGPARALTLPLDPNETVGDDVEGLAWRGGHVYALVSWGYVERFTPDGKGGLRRDGPAYALGAPPYIASPTAVPGQPPDWEGLCLRPATSTARCAGYAASRAYDWLVCLVFDGERLRVDPVRPRVALRLKKHALSDCAFGAADGPARDTLLVATNIYGGSTVYRVDEGTSALSPIDVEGTANDEAIAVDNEGRLYQVMDANSARSPSVRATCSGW